MHSIDFILISNGKAVLTPSYPACLNSLVPNFCTTLPSIHLIPFIPFNFTRENIGWQWKRALLLVRIFSTMCKSRPPPLSQSPPESNGLCYYFHGQSSHKRAKIMTCLCVLSNISKTYPENIFHYASLERAIKHGNLRE